MRYLALLPVLALALAACSEAPIPSEPEAQRDQSGPLFSPATTSSAGYTAIDLGSLGYSSTALGINDAGVVVGTSVITLGLPDARAFLWDGSFHDLGTLGGNMSGARGINSAGQVAGTSSTASGNVHAFRWDGTAVPPMQDLATLGGNYSEATAINDAGHVVGRSITSSGESHAFLWDGIDMLDLGTLGGNTSYAFAINDADQVVGYSTTGTPVETHAFLWDGTAVPYMTDLGTLGGGGQSMARGINKTAKVVGHSTTFPGSPFSHAFLWDGTVVPPMRDLDPLGDETSQAWAINDAGLVVGDAVTSSHPRAFLWDGTAMQDLGTLSGGVQSAAYGINNVGVVVGSSHTASGTHHATLWRILTPLEQLERCASLATDLETAGTLNGGQAHSLVNKINLATAMLNDGRDTPGINKLEAFQNEARGYVSGGILTAEQGDDLVSCVQAVIDAL